jgi:hypothetical protein
MKIRNGFVSNSSSSSFAIYGASIIAEDLKQFLPDDTNYNIDYWEEDVDWYDVDKVVGVQMGTEFSFFYNGESCDEFYIGREFTTIGDDETGKQFKDAVEEKIIKFFGTDYNCNFIEETVQS